MIRSLRNATKKIWRNPIDLDVTSHTPIWYPIKCLLTSFYQWFGTSACFTMNKSWSLQIIRKIDDAALKLKKWSGTRKLFHKLSVMLLIINATHSTFAIIILFWTYSAYRKKIFDFTFSNSPIIVQSSGLLMISQSELL